MEKLYINIKNRRQELHLSQEALAAAVGYTDRSSIAKIEAGKVDITLSMLKKIAHALDTEPMILLGWEENEND